MSKKKNRPKKNYLKEDTNELKKNASSSKFKKKEETTSSDNESFLKNEKFLKISGLLLIALSVFLVVSFISYLFAWKNDYDKIHNISAYDLFFNKNLIVYNLGGKTGAVLSHLFITRGFGIISFVFIFLFVLWGLKLFINYKPFNLYKTFLYSSFFILWFPVTIGFFFPKGNMVFLQGVYGKEANLWLASLIGKTGTVILLLFIFITFLIVAFNFKVSLNFLLKANKVKEDIQNHNISLETIDKDNKDEESENITNEEFQKTLEFTVTSQETQNVQLNKQSDNTPEFEIENPQTVNDIMVPESAENDEDSIPHYSTNTPYDPTLDLPDFILPGLDLLEEHGNGNISVDKSELEANKDRIIQTLNNYAIKIDKIKATPGPTVTLYEIIPAPGIRISRIKNLEDDIALSLSALGIRIIAPMPGKGTIGIEVPNMKPEIVSMKSMLSSERFINSPYALPIALGKTISNDPYIADLTRMPHLLIAGATGQGKSVGINAIIASLLYKKHPAYIKFVLVDPKKVELTLFSHIERHYLARLPDVEEAIITDTKQVIRTLNSLCIEMDQRYNLLKDAQVRNIREYNMKFISRKLNPNEGHHFLPYIILIIDEFADLFMTSGKEVEMPIARLAQLARAIGIHLIIATQRPSVNIITGTIKANFPVRMAFRVISKIDSRTILDMGGADQLVGRGDMLLSTGSDLVRLQCPFLDTPEVEKITEFIGSQRAYPEPFLLPECIDDSADETANLDPHERDELFAEAARIIVQYQHGSTSLLQRKLKLGYNRAGRLIDQLEAAGIVGPFEGSKAREVKIKDEVTLEQFLSNLQT